MENPYQQSDILYVKDSLARVQILRYLSNKEDFVRTTQLSEDLRMGRGKLYFHAKGLRQKGLVDIQQATPRSVHVKITEKGKEVIEEINKKKSKKRRQT